ncbi:MAG: c-type cytochrome [Planctomycetales bacterium]|nr:c-type cytochrome [Planctomycetales bacterium]
MRLSYRATFFFLLFPAQFLFAQDQVKSEPSTQKPAVQPTRAPDEDPADANAAREQFQVPAGFQVELLYNVPKGDQGSWVNLTIDSKGRLIATDQGDKGLYRITPGKVGTDEETKVEKLAVNMTSAHGFLFAFDSLYVSVNGGPGSGLYRLRDTTEDGELDSVEKLKEFRGGGEHGPHALRLSPDRKSIYVICGNHTDPPAGITHTRMLHNWGEDLLLPRQWDARGHARGRLAPGGWIAKTDPDGTTWEIVSIGYRNAFDMDFNADGELFSYDADMEWDLGMPWYRPTRLCHAVSGSDFGWRSGTGKWPAYFEDSLPSVVDIGPGSPVGVTFGYGTKFPAKYQKALYLLDWTFGTMYAIHLTPDGASYTGEKEEFVARVALPLTDAVVGLDGALYFTVGGRGTDSALYRVTYVGTESTEPAKLTNDEGSSLRALRRKLESFHEAGATADMDLIWSNLAHSDRHIRYAARTALEHQPIATWKADALAQTDATARAIAAIALARAGSNQLDDAGKAALLPEVVALLGQSPFSNGSKQLKLAVLRAYALAFIRLGQPNTELASKVLDNIEAEFPSGDNDLDKELSRVLVYLNAPTVVQKTLALMEKDYVTDALATSQLLERNKGYGNTIAEMISNQPELQKLHYAFVLRNQRYGWTLDERKSYFSWLAAAKGRAGGASYNGFIDNIRKEAMENLSDAEKAALESEDLTKPIPAEELPKPVGPGQEWTAEEIVALTKTKMIGRDFERGKQTFAAAKCIICHRFDGIGGATGPDLTSVVSRFSYSDFIDSLVHPSKTISDQYRATIVHTDDGLVLTGRVVGEADGKITVQTNPEDATQIKVLEKGSIERMDPSPTSLMPDKLLNVLNEDEVLDLLAYLMSRGNKDDLYFKK